MDGAEYLLNRFRVYFSWKKFIAAERAEKKRDCPRPPQSNRIKDDGSWFSVAADPAGAQFYLMQLVEIEPSVD